jgi:hypothetical protein
MMSMEGCNLLGVYFAELGLFAIGDQTTELPDWSPWFLGLMIGHTRLQEDSPRFL